MTIGWAKPPMWTYREHLVHPMWRGHRPTFIAPLWEGTGTAFDYVTGERASEATGTWAQNELGTAFKTTASTDEMVWTDSDVRHCVTDNWAMFFSVFKTGKTGSNPSFVSRRRSGFSSGLWEGPYEASSKTNFSFHNGSLRTVTWNEDPDNKFSDGQIYNVLITRHEHRTPRWTMYINGDRQDPDTDNTNSPTQAGTSHDLVIGKLIAQSSGNAYYGEYGALYLWQDTVLGDDHAIALAQDPFSPVRPDNRIWPTVFVQAAAGGLSIPVAWHHYNTSFRR